MCVKIIQFNSGNQFFQELKFGSNSILFSKQSLSALPANQVTRRALLVNLRMVAKNEFFTAALISPQMLREPLRSTLNVISDVARYGQTATLLVGYSNYGRV